MGEAGEKKAEKDSWEAEISRKGAAEGWIYWKNLGNRVLSECMVGVQGGS